MAQGIQPTALGLLTPVWIQQHGRQVLSLVLYIQLSGRKVEVPEISLVSCTVRVSEHNGGKYIIDLVIKNIHLHC